MSGIISSAVQVSSFVGVNGEISVENLTFCVHPSDGNIVANFLLKTALLSVSLTFVLFPSY